MRMLSIIAFVLLPTASAQAQVVTDEDFRRLDRAEEIVRRQRMEQIGLLGAYRALENPRLYRPLGPPYGMLPRSPIYPRPALSVYGPPVPVQAQGVPVAPPEFVAPGRRDGKDLLRLDEPLPPATAENFSDEDLAEARQLRESLLAGLTARFDLGLPTVRQLDNRLAQLTPTELRALSKAWELRQEKAREQLNLREKEILNEAVLNLERAKAFRDHLQREFQLELLESRAEIEALNRAPLLWNYGAAFPPVYPAPAFGYPPIAPPYRPW